LVVGNDTYEILPDLNNAGADAKGMGMKLHELGFDVILKLDTRWREFGRPPEACESKASSAEVALIFYVGHGIQAGGKNYLIPSNAQIETETDLRYEGIDSGHFLASMTVRVRI